MESRANDRSNDSATGLEQGRLVTTTARVTSTTIVVVGFDANPETALPISMTRDGGWMDGWSRKGEKDRLAFTISRPHSFPVCTQRRGVRARQTREHAAALKLAGEMDPARYASNTAINFIAGMH